jgi:3-hydroxyisobutyrate dehydrogenase-like beta-hydroxyacid dehydrogenase
MAQIALFYPGAMGRALAEALAPFDHGIISFLAERSARTRDNASAAGVHSAASFQDAVDASDVVVSVVPPSEAIAVAQRYGAALRSGDALGPTRLPRVARLRPLYVDANSVAPATVCAIEKLVTAAGARVVDGVFLGPSNPISWRTLLLLSGSDAEAAAELFAPAVAVKVIGNKVGQASAAKMAMALLTKALVALFLEMACAAAKGGCLDATLMAMRQIYPGTMEFIERTLPTYPRHASRRVVEMQEAQAWLTELGQIGTMTRAATAVLDRFAKAEFDGAAGDFEQLLRSITTLQPWIAAA